MADMEGTIESKQFHTDVPAPKTSTNIKGAGGYDWGMHSRLAQIFDPADGRTVMLAFDHGYFQGPTSGLERVDLNVVPLAPHADALMCTRGMVRTIIPPNVRKPIVVRASGGPSILKDLSNERIAMDMADAARINATAVAVQVFIGSDDFETQSVHNMTQLVDAGIEYGIPTMGVTAVGRDLVRDARYLGLACRIIGELGAQMVKTYYCDEDFANVTAASPIPVIVAGGKKVPVLDALEMAHRSINEGAAGVDMGRNIFQRQHPEAMIQAVRAVVHNDASPADAQTMYRDLSGGLED